MNCDDCKALISRFLDNDLDESRASGVREHLALCVPCAQVCEEIASMIDLCAAEDAEALVPPNSQALWCRINNIIEGELDRLEIARAAEESRLEEQASEKRRFWRLSVPQLASGLLAVALISSLLTVVGIKNYMTPAATDFTARSSESLTTFEKLLGKAGLIETPQQARERRIRELQAAIEYWNQRVELRRSQWDARMREAFDRNLNVINESVSDYQAILEQDPEDDITGEMLDSALDEKMNLLREFSEL